MLAGIKVALVTTKGLRFTSCHILIVKKKLFYIVITALVTLKSFKIYLNFSQKKKLFELKTRKALISLLSKLTILKILGPVIFLSPSFRV